MTGLEEGVEIEVEDVLSSLVDTAIFAVLPAPLAEVLDVLIKPLEDKVVKKLVHEVTGAVEDIGEG